MNFRNRFLAGIAAGATAGALFVIFDNIKSHLENLFLLRIPGILGESSRPITSFPSVITIVILCFTFLGFILSILLARVNSKWSRLGIWGGLFSVASIIVRTFPIFYFGKIDQALFYQWVIFEISYLAIIGAVTGILAGLVFNRLVPTSQTSKKGMKRNAKAIVGILIAFLPIAIVIVSLSLRSIIMYDEDLPILLMIIASPIIFLIGAFISAFSFKGSERKALPITGLILNVIFLILSIFILTGVRI